VRVERDSVDVGAVMLRVEAITGRDTTQYTGRRYGVDRTVGKSRGQILPGMMSLL
jgi:hypothetical protein